MELLGVWGMSDYQWSVGDSEDASDLINRLTAENEALREEVERLQTQNNRIAKILNEAPEADHVFTEFELAQHDAEVIEREAHAAADALGEQPQKVAFGMGLFYTKLLDRADQLRQQVKEVQS